MAWFAIPFSMATALGLAGRALDLPLTSGEAGQGLVPPAVAVHLMGRGGAFLVAFQLFLAITSTANSEQLAVASLFSYDVYKRYINKDATGAKMIMVSRVSVCVWGIFSGIIATILNEMGIGLGWVYGAMGNFIGSAVAPITFALAWKDCNGAGAIAGAVVGQISSIVVWCAVAPSQSADGKTVDVNSLGDIDALLAANVTALLVSLIVCVVVSLISPQNFDWNVLKEKTDAFMVEKDKHAELDASGDESKEAMDKAYTYTSYGAMGVSLLLVVIWPLLSLPADPFSKGYFAFWVAIAFIWGHVAFCITVLLPIYEFIFPPKESAEPKDGTQLQTQATPAEPVGFSIAPMPDQAPAIPTSVPSAE